MEMDEIRERIRQADMVLVGLGEEFDDTKRLRESTVYQSGRKLLMEGGCGWLVPAWSEYCSGKLEDVITPALEKLMELLDGKEYFLVSVSTNSTVERVSGGGERSVMPCGGILQKQCTCGCREELLPLTEADKANIGAAFEKLYDGESLQGAIPKLGRCSQCGSPMVLNNILAENYNESGYLGMWQLYTKWLQGTLNHKLFLLELGVGLQFPTVVRWPFEKITAYNEKAFLCRVHERLYQLPEKIVMNGCGISQNAIDWLGQLC